jgi:hypothetical protein
MIEDEREEESVQAHHIMCELRTIVGRFLGEGENNEREVEEAVAQADTWITAWRERGLKRETVREVLTRMGYLHDVVADAGRELADQPGHLVAFVQSLEWPTHRGSEGSGQVMRRMIEVFDAYARMVRRATGEPVIVGDLVESLLTRVVPRESAP